ncbi:MAG: N-acetylmuramoyl-L-alanine amidase, partial [Clostridiales bacterium]|nr:N-acetylmuramoyl-L-alanine amidase [Clostridiales bacterium]
MNAKKKTLIALISIVSVLLLTAGAFCVTYFLLGLDIFGIQKTNVKYLNKYSAVFNQTVVATNQPTSFVKGAFIVNGVDFNKSEEDSIDTIKTDIDSAINGISDYKFDTVFISAINNAEVITKNSEDNNLINCLEYALQKADEKSLYTVCCIDAEDIIDTNDFSVNSDFISSLCKEYAFKGLMLTNLDKLNFEGSDYSFEEKTEKLNSCIKHIEWFVKQARGDIYFGVEVPAVWANFSADERGSKTTADYQGYINGSIDALAYAQRGIVDFIFVDCEYSTKDTKVPFETILNWWGEALKDNSANLIIGHSVFKICSADYEGWQSPDELIKEASIVKNNPKCFGSVYYSYSDLKKDVQNSTSVLMNYYGGQIEDKLVFNELVVTSLKSSTVKTNESIIKVAGSSDPNFPLYLNSNEVDRTEYGYFSKDINLKPGNNTVTLSHKGTVKTYTINYERILIQSVSPANSTYVMGNTSLSLSAIAFKNSTVYAVINGQRVNMSMVDEASDEFNTSEGSDFVRYVGEYNLPASKTTEQNLGAVKFYCINDGYNYSLNGGSIIVNKVVENPTMVEIVKDNTEVRSASTSSSDYSPEYTPLVKGTLDYYVQTVTSGNTKYCILKSGRRVLYSNVELRDFSSMTDNKATLVSVTSNADATTLTLNTSWKVPFNVITDSHGKKVNSYTPAYIDIKFNYTPFVSGNADFSSSDVIKGSEWLQNNNGESVLRLYLKKAGGYYGYTAQYNSSGNLVIAFKNHDTASIKGKVVVLDAGHGAADNMSGAGLDPGALSSNPNYHEYVITLKIAQKAKALLEAKGATVYMTRNTLITTTLQYQRVTKIIGWNPDASVSIHCNSSTSSSPYGTETYYYYNNALPLASNIHNKLVSAYTNSIYHKNDSNISRGTKYGEYAVTRVTNCPAVLVEVGFISNQTEGNAMIKDINGENYLAKAIADGIEAYFLS